MNAQVVGLLNPGRAGEQEAVDVSPPGPSTGTPSKDTAWTTYSHGPSVPWPSPPTALTEQQRHWQGDSHSVTAMGTFPGTAWRGTRGPAGGRAGLTAAKGPPHTTWNLLSYPAALVRVCLFNQMGSCWARL